MTGTVHELHHIVRYDGFSPWSIPGSHVGSPLSLESELLADHLGIRGVGGGGGGKELRELTRKSDWMSSHHCCLLSINSQ